MIFKIDCFQQINFFNSKENKLMNDKEFSSELSKQDETVIVMNKDKFFKEFMSNQEFN